MILTGAYVFVFKIQVACAILVAILYNASYFVLRAKQPDLPHPFRAFGHPVLPALILLVTIALFAAVVIADPASGLWTAGFVAICIPVGVPLRTPSERRLPHQPRKSAVQLQTSMLRHSCGFAVANRGYDLQLIQDYLGHRDPQQRWLG